MRKPSKWTDYFHRAAQEEIGIAIDMGGPIDQGLLCNEMHAARPDGYEDYTVVVPTIANTVFIVKPGVTLD